MKPENASGLFIPEAPDGPAAVEVEEREGCRERDERRGSRTELLATLERLERTLDEMRGGLEARCAWSGIVSFRRRGRSGSWCRCWWWGWSCGRSLIGCSGSTGRYCIS